MTVTLDKKQIHLGWETAIAIILFLVVTMWGGGEFTANFLKKQDDIYNAMLRQTRKDSIYDAKMTKIDTVAIRVNQLRNDLHEMKKHGNRDRS